MKTWMLRMGGLVLVVVMAFGAIGSAAAQEPDPPPDNVNRPERRLAGAVLDAVAATTGLENADILAQMREGKSLAQIVQENGADLAAVQAAAVADLSAQIDAAVADGRLSEERAAALLGRLDDAVERTLNVQRPNAPRIQHPVAQRGARLLIATTAEMSGLEVADVVQALRDGATLAEIAAEHGVDSNAVIQAALAQTAETLQVAVAEGRITQEQMDQVLAKAPEFYAEAMNRALPVRPSPVRDRVRQGIDRTLVGVLAETVGMEPAELVRELVPTPPSLAEVAAAHGVDINAVIAAAEARITEQLNQAVADGRITEDQAAAALENLHEWLVERAESPFRLRPAATMGQSRQRGPEPGNVQIG
jgi:uncharacterized protein (DUF433 family)